MPLVVAGITGGGAATINDWTMKLMGKKLTDDDAVSDHNSFARKELPDNHRVVVVGGGGDNSAVTMDYQPDR